MDLKELGKALRGAREKRGWKQDELVAEVGKKGVVISQGTISAWELGNSTPGLLDFLAVWKVLGVPISDLVPDLAGAAIEVPPDRKAVAVRILQRLVTIGALLPEAKPSIWEIVEKSLDGTLALAEGMRAKPAAPLFRGQPVKAAEAPPAPPRKRKSQGRAAADAAEEGPGYGEAKEE